MSKRRLAISKCFCRFALILLLLQGCQSWQSGGSGAPRFPYIAEQTQDCIAVYGSNEVSEEQFSRGYADITDVLSAMDGGIRQGLLNAGAKMLIVSNEAELEKDIGFFLTLLPVEAVFADNGGVDETLPDSTGSGVSTTKLELMYLVVYYSLLKEPSLSDTYRELRDAYSQAMEASIFSPGEAYEDGYVDEIHRHASEQHALKYGSYLFGLYAIYFGNDSGQPGEFTITTKAGLQERNPLGDAFVKKFLDL